MHDKKSPTNHFQKRWGTATAVAGVYRISFPWGIEKGTVKTIPPQTLTAALVALLRCHILRVKEKQD
ncbi:hypothetical protein LJB90_02490 [Eubacteriales bacterium OttesenSCG-928-G02]|nr:hypothetical protein [Eubacteriales bacterium OttesenSCG-928-G02]MDL2287415.1 hypothetical protein [Eubacteriales bacterium OttesenSCG-928-G02]